MSAVAILQIRQLDLSITRLNAGCCRFVDRLERDASPF